MYKVTANWFNDYQMQISDGRHRWVTDLPEDKGGADAGPSPFDLLNGALAASVCVCTKKYAENSKLPVEDVIVDVEGDWVKKSGSDDEVYAVKVTARFKGDLSESDLKRLERAAAACPVKEAVTGGLTIETQVEKL